MKPAPFATAFPKNLQKKKEKKTRKRKFLKFFDLHLLLPRSSQAIFMIETIFAGGVNNGVSMTTIDDGGGAAEGKEGFVEGVFDGLFDGVIEEVG